MPQSSEYSKAYDRAKQELADLLAKQKEIESRIVLIRQSIQTLATLAESEGVDIEPSAEAAYLLEHSSLADEVRAILKSAWPAYARPNVIRDALQVMGHDLSRYTNPQATIHMVLKRMVESEEVIEGIIPSGPDAGKKTYRIDAPDAWNKAIPAGRVRELA
jgi:DNA repair ATPase RecN